MASMHHHFTNCDKLLSFVKDEVLQDSDFFEERIVEVVKNHEMKSFYVQVIVKHYDYQESMTYFNW